MKAKIVKQINLTAPDKIGLLSDISEKLAGVSVNLEAICAYVMEGKAMFMIVTSDNAKAVSALQSVSAEIKEEEVVLVDLENKIGAAKEMGDKLQAAGVNMCYLYGTTGSESGNIVFQSDNNQRAVVAIA